MPHSAHMVTSGESVRSVAWINVDSRHYRLQKHKEPLPSVTSILSVIDRPALVQWSTNTALQAVKTRLYEGAHSHEGDHFACDHSLVEWAIESSKAAGKDVASEAASFGTRAHDGSWSEALPLRWCGW